MNNFHSNGDKQIASGHWTYCFVCHTHIDRNIFICFHVSASKPAELKSRFIQPQFRSPVSSSSASWSRFNLWQRNFFFSPHIYVTLLASCTKICVTEFKANKVSIFFGNSDRRKSKRKSFYQSYSPRFHFRDLQAKIFGFKIPDAFGSMIYQTLIAHISDRSKLFKLKLMA